MSVSYIVSTLLSLTYSEGSRTPWRATADLGEVGQLTEGLGISEWNIDD
jgi:hypothetical protein